MNPKTTIPEEIKELTKLPLFELISLANQSRKVNILIPIKGTPLESVNSLSPVEIIRTIALFRIILKSRNIKIAAGRETVLKDFQGLAFLAGANGLIVGGYLTVKGREIKDDQGLIQDILRIWRDEL